MLLPDDITEGLRVFHVGHGIGRVQSVNKDTGRCSIAYESGITEWGFRLEHVMHSLMSLEQAELRDRIHEILRKTTLQGAIIEPGVPSNGDKSLAEAWTNWSRATSPTLMARMLSARMAERAVAIYYDRRGCDVEDVSLTQLDNRRGGDWVQYDLRICNVSVDVKNARRSARNSRAYTDFCVPKFKSNRAGTEVRIAGVLSDWNSLEDIEHGRSRVRFLGTVTNSRITELRDMLKDGPLEFSVDSANSPSFLPPWIFDYASKDYRAISRELEDFVKYFAAVGMPKHNELHILPALLASGMSGIPGWLLPSASWLSDLASKLQVRHVQHGPSLPVLFLTILEHFVSMLVDGAPIDYDPSRYTTLVVPSKSHSDRPFFLYDPEHSIESLIGSLTSLWKNRNQYLRDICHFKLCNLNILRGKTQASAPWVTVLAYCGGRIKGAGTNQPCGQIPLILGEHELCGCCRLICPTCGYCGSTCSECAPRQNRIATTKQQSDSGDSRKHFPRH